MHIRHHRETSGIRAVALLVVSITITAAIAVALLIDTVTPLTLSAAPPDRRTTVHPAVHSIAFIDGRC